MITPHPREDAAWHTMVLRMPPELIAVVTCTLEAYDNLCLIRTFDKAAGIIRVWCHAPLVPTLRTVIAELRTQVPIATLSEHEGMAGLDEVMPRDE